MTRLLILLVGALTTAAKLLGPGGARAVMAENLLLKQQLLIVCRPRRRAPNLSSTERFILGFLALVVRPARIATIAIAVRPSTLLRFHQYLVARKYRELFSPERRSKPGPKGPSADLVHAIVELKRCNPSLAAHASR